MHIEKINISPTYNGMGMSLISCEISHVFLYMGRLPQGWVVEPSLEYFLKEYNAGRELIFMSDKMSSDRGEVS